jgi:hypothetical protein
MARGDFLALMDADDICLPTRFAVLLNYLEKHQECVAVGSAVSSIGIEPPYIRTLPNRQSYVPGVRQEVAVVHPSAMIRAASMKLVGGYRTAFPAAQDADLWRRLIRVGEIHNVPDVLLQYRHHTGQISNRLRPEQILLNGAAVSLSAAIGEVFPLGPEPLTEARIRQIATSHPDRSVRTNLHVDIALSLLARRDLVRATLELVGVLAVDGRVLVKRIKEVTLAVRAYVRGSWPQIKPFPTVSRGSRSSADTHS